MSPEYFLYHEKRALFWGAHGVETAAPGMARLFKSKFAAEQFAREHLPGQGWTAKPKDWE